ncbi:uncharacterized protein LOC132181651 [Corylus avellana]|uniref:uncharacterized protein LOC132181651 n=1 Tax=Corylus avellana TaxID=13451 RepID=UPI00286A18DB|nr:uncharacterized protein LOC132181651 [Corylus avellana]
MAEDLTSMWGNFTLTEEEEAFDEVPEEELIDIGNKGRACLVGRIMSERNIGKKTLKAKMIRSWMPTGSMVFNALGNNIFLIEFENAWDKSRVLEGRPWTFDGSLFSVLEFNGTSPPAELPFNIAYFWVRIFNLPLACMGRATGERLGSHLGEVEEVDTNEEGVGWGKYHRVRVKLNVYKPLLHGRMLKVKDKTHWVAFQYEKIPWFCFSYGVICNAVSGCSKRNHSKVAGEKSKKEYGPWLRVSFQNRSWDNEKR